VHQKAFLVLLPNVMAIAGPSGDAPDHEEQTARFLQAQAERVENHPTCFSAGGQSLVRGIKIPKQGECAHPQEGYFPRDTTCGPAERRRGTTFAD
jgi:hypothetical protein